MEKKNEEKYLNKAHQGKNGRDEQPSTESNETSNPTTRENQPGAMDVPVSPVPKSTAPNERRRTKKTLLYVCVVLLLLVVGSAVGVALGLTAGGDTGDDGSLVAPIDSPTVPACFGF
jgi:hypothetical protein